MPPDDENKSSKLQANTRDTYQPIQPDLMDLVNHEKTELQMAFMDDYSWRTSELVDREAPKGSKYFLQVGTSAVLAVKQEPQNLVMPAQAAVQNQQEVSAAVHRSLEASVYGGMAVDKSWLQGMYPQ